MGIVSMLALVACGQSERDVHVDANVERPDIGLAAMPDTGTPARPDSSRPAPDAEVVADRCPSEGCPAGSYCDLRTDRCVEGCLDDMACSEGAICEERRCIAGCRSDAQCGARHICEAQTCVVGCRDCPDDGEECTDERCLDGECVHRPRADGSACRDDRNECSRDVCQSGRCEHAALEGVSMCEASEYPPHGCIDRSCTPPDSYCSMSNDPGDTYGYAPRNHPSGGGSLVDWCRCEGNRLSWKWSDRVGGGEDGDDCTVCADYGTYAGIDGVTRFIGCFH